MILTGYSHPRHGDSTIGRLISPNSAMVIRALLVVALLCVPCVLGQNGKKQYTVNTLEDVQNLDENSTFSGEYFDYVNGDPSADQISLRPIDTAVITIYSIITIVGLIANAVVFFVIFAGNEMGKTVTAIYVLQLTIADTIFLFTLPIFSMQKVSNDWNFGQGLCKMCQTIKFMNYYAGIFFLTAMSVDRYVAVAYSTRLTQVRTKRRTYFICACVWISALVMSIPIILYSNSEKNSGVTFCRIMFPGYEKFNESVIVLGEYSGMPPNYIEDSFVFDDYETRQSEDSEDYQSGNIHICDHHLQPVSYKIWIGVDFVIAFLIPFIVVVISYALIVTHLKTAEEKIGHTATSRAAKMRKRVTKMVAALVVCFTICWLPHHVLVLVKIKGFPSQVPPCYALEEFFIALAFSNSALNPLLYTFMGNNFRERLRKSVKNTQTAVKRRTSSRSSAHKRSTNSHSDPSNGKRMSNLMVHYKKGSTNGSVKDASKDGGKSKQQKSKFGSLSLLGSRKEKSSSNDIHSGDGSQRAEIFDAATATSMIENTVETKI